MPYAVTTVLFKSVGRAGSSGEYLSLLVGVTFLVPALLSILTVIAAIYQLRNNMRLKGCFNLLLGILFALLFVIGPMLMFIYPPGVGSG